MTDTTQGDVAPLNVGICVRCGNATGPTHVVTRRDGQRLTLCRDPFACWERESTPVLPPERRLGA